MKSTRQSLFITVSLLFGLASYHASAAKPNILFFLVDDMGIADTSVPFLYDHKGEQVDMPLNSRYRTPNIGRLARQGRKFTNAHAYAVCTPTRVALMTGLSAERQRITTWTHPKAPQDTGAYDRDGLKSAEWRMEGLDPELPNLPKLLAANGYRTIHCGKAHFGPDSTPSGDPTKLGFHINIAGYGGGGPGSYWGEKNYSAAWRGGDRMWDVPGLDKYHGTPTFLTEALTLELNEALGRAVADRKPFFAHMSHYAVHAPFETDERFAGNYPDLKGKELAFATLVEGMDKSLGDLLDHLEKLGIAEETLVVFYSDNGSDGPPNKPLRGSKGWRFQGGSRVPMIIAWAKPNPDHPMQKALPIPAGSRDHRMVTPMDFMPTLLQVAGIPIPAGLSLDGEDIRAMFRGIPGSHGRDEFLVHFPHGRHNNKMFSTMVAGDWKIIYEYATRSWQFTNLAYDPFEEENWIERKPAEALMLAERMMTRLRERKASFPRDAETGEEVLPDLAPLERIVKRATGPARELAADDLDLSARVKPIAPENIYSEPDHYCWCNSIIKGDDGRYHMFYVRWPKEIGFLGWLAHSEIARAVSDHPAGPYEFAGLVLPARGGQSWQRLSAHNAKIKRFGDRYYLYFIATNSGVHGFDEEELAGIIGYRHPYWMRPLRNNQRTYVAVADSLEGPWEVREQPAIEPHGPIATVTVNPAVWQLPTGSYRMIIKGDQIHGRPVQALAESDSPEGPFHLLPDLVFSSYSEDASVWHDDERNLTYCIIHDKKGFVLLVSDDGTHWQRARHFRVMGNAIPTTTGADLRPSRYERPAVFVEDGKPRVLGGAASFDNKSSKILLIPLDCMKKGSCSHRNAR